MIEISLWLQPDGQSWQIAFNNATPRHSKAIIRCMKNFGLRRAQGLEKEFNELLGEEAKEQLSWRVFNGKLGRCILLEHRRKRFLSLSWRGRADGDELASMILSNCEFKKRRYRFGHGP